MGHALATAGRFNEAQAVIHELTDDSKGRYHYPFWNAVVYAGLGETEQALDWLERACEQRDSWMIFLKVHPYFESLRDLPRFQRIIKRIGFPEKKRLLAKEA